MTIDRRGFIGTALAAGAGMASAQEEAPHKKLNVPTTTAKVTKLFRSPDKHPNALAAADDGLWIGDQVSENVNKVDWNTGKALLSFPTEAHNTSGLAAGGGYLWISCNGGVSNRRPPRPHDKPISEILQADMKNGKTVKFHQMVWTNGIHGINYSEATKSLWVVAPSLQIICEMDPKDMRIMHIIPVKGDRPHGLVYDNGMIWVIIAGQREIQKLDAKTGKVLEIISLGSQDPDPHDLALHDGSIYYCDAGLTATFAGSAGGYICKLEMPKQITRNG
jgi:streptogramin lyase